MTSNEIRDKFLKFYKERGHVVISSAPLVPENDPTTLFTGSGMQPLIPYLLGQPHAEGNKLVNSQKAFRSGDIDDVGDNRHTTFFEMLGNWSLGDYFKTEQLPWVFEFLTGEIGLDPKKIYVSAFIGDEKNNIPKDTEAGEIWKGLFATKGIEAKEVEIGSEENGYDVGMQGGRIFYYDVKKNWWSRSGVPANMPTNEPGGPDSELFYEFESFTHDPKYGKHCHPNCDCGRFLEIGNSVFMEYKKNEDGTFSKLPQKNVDFGGGFERMVAVSSDLSDIFKIDIFEHLISTIEKATGNSYDDEKYTKSYRIVADHLRSSVFLIGDGINPSNSDQGYFVRRLLRRAIRHMDKLKSSDEQLLSLDQFVGPLLENYKEAYPDTYNQKVKIAEVIKDEENKFRKTLGLGLKEFEKISKRDISGFDAFVLFSTYGFPVEITEELAKEKGINVNTQAFEEEFKKHQELSRVGAEQKFKGGLGDTSETSVKYHTTTHLLHQALRQVLGDHVGQKGSNITPERLRFDFTHPAKMTDEEKQKVEEIVNEQIKKALPVQVVTMSKEDADKTGALHFFGDKYGESVTVYYIGDTIEQAFSKEFCGGPHVTNTSELGTFKIAKEEAVSQGVRRIKAVLS